MAEPNAWQRFLAAVNREYERRVRAASLVTDYGADQHHPHDDEADDGDAAVIVNIPRGTRRPLHPPDAPAADAEQP